MIEAFVDLLRRYPEVTFFLVLGLLAGKAGQSDVRVQPRRIAGGSSSSLAGGTPFAERRVRLLQPLVAQGIAPNREGVVWPGHEMPEITTVGRGTLPSSWV